MDGECPTGIAPKVWNETMPNCAMLNIYMSGTQLSKKGWGVCCHVCVIGAH